MIFFFLNFVICFAIFDEKKGEKGHVKPANYLDAHEKFLLGVATKGGRRCFVGCVVIAFRFYTHAMFEN